MNHDERCCADELDTEITIADRIDTVARDAVKTESPRDGIAIDRICRSCQGRRAERQHVDALAGIYQTFLIARQHFEVRQTPVGEQNRLGTLKMSVTRNDRVAIRF